MELLVAHAVTGDNAMNIQLHANVCHDPGDPPLHSGSNQSVTQLADELGVSEDTITPLETA